MSDLTYPKDVVCPRCDRHALASEKVETLPRSDSEGEVSVKFEKITCNVCRLTDVIPPGDADPAIIGHDIHSEWDPAEGETFSVLYDSNRGGMTWLDLRVKDVTDGEDDVLVAVNPSGNARYQITRARRSLMRESDSGNWTTLGEVDLIVPDSGGGFGE